MNQLIASLDESGRRDLNRIAARASRQSVVDYHHKFDRSGGWQNKSLPTWGAGRKRTHWGNTITTGWGAARISANGFSLVNSTVGLRLKIHGGIVTKRDKMLTIPNVPEAHGRSAAEYSRRFGKLFFFQKNQTKALAENRNGKLRVVYWLKNSVTFKPVKGAMPPDNVITDPAAAAIAERILQALD